MKPMFRDQEIDDLKALFNKNEVLFVKGVSGVGKTTLIEHILDVRYHSIKIHLHQDFTITQHIEKSKEIIAKKKANSSIFYKFKNIFSFKKLNCKWSLGLSLANKNYDSVVIRSTDIGGIQITNKDNLDINISISNLNLTREDSSLYLKKYFSLVKNNIDCLIFENSELIQDEDFYHLQNLLIEKPKNFKIIFEIGELKSTTNLYSDLESILKNKNINFKRFDLEAFEPKRSQQFYDYYKTKKKLTSYDYYKNNGIPLLILLFGGAFIPYKDDLTNSLNHDDFNDELYLLLTVLWGLKINENTFLKYVNKYKIAVKDFNKFKNSSLIKLDDGLISFSHPLIQSFILDSKIQELKEFIEKLLEHNNGQDFEALYIKLKFLNRYNLKLNPNDIDFLIDYLCEKIETFDFQSIISILSYKNEFYSELTSSTKNIINLIELQTKLYNFRLENLDISQFDIKIKIIANLLMFQYHDHKDYFEETEKEIILFQKELLTNNDYISIIDKDLQQYLSIILNGILISVKRALSKYDEAKEYWIMAIQASENVDDYKNIYDYLMNMYPFYRGIKETFNEQSSKFFETSFIKNNYIKAKRIHNINAINLYYSYDNYLYMKDKLYNTIDFLKTISPLETSYTYNNLLVLYIVNRKIAEAERIINDIDIYFFESYDLMSFYNNAIVLGIIKNDFEFSLKYYEKAKEINFKDKSFDAKIHYNMALLYKTKGDIDNMEKCFQQMHIDENYDNGLIENKKQFIRTNNITDNFIYLDNEKDIREHFIYWFQIIHFWDFDIPLVNKKIIKSLLSE
jgi:hypothetical protein